jgi:DNA-binding LytR/AlgR family response regulator
MTNFNFLFIRQKNQIFKVPYQEISCIKSEGNYCHLVTNNQTYSFKSSLSKLKKALPTSDFIQVNRNHVIPIRKISQVDLSENTILTGEDKYQIGGRYRDELFATMKVLP